MKKAFDRYMEAAGHDPQYMKMARYVVLVINEDERVWKAYAKAARDEYGDVVYDGDSYMNTALGLCQAILKAMQDGFAQAKRVWGRQWDDEKVVDCLTDNVYEWISEHLAPVVLEMLNQ